jgi:predicted permease
LKQVILLQAAMPAAVFPIIMSRHYGGDPGLALRIVLGTSLAALLTMPWWLRWGAHLLGIQTQAG